MNLTLLAWTARRSANAKIIINLSFLTNYAEKHIFKFDTSNLTPLATQLPPLDPMGLTILAATNKTSNDDWNLTKNIA